MKIVHTWGVPLPKKKIRIIHVWILRWPNMNFPRTIMVSMPSVIYLALSIKTCIPIPMQYIIYCTVARQETPRYNKKLLAELPLCRVYDASLLCWERDQYPGNQRYTNNRLHQRYTATSTLEYTTSFNTKPFGHTSLSGCYDFIISVCLRHIQPHYQYVLIRYIRRMKSSTSCERNRCPTDTWNIFNFLL